MNHGRTYRPFRCVSAPRLRDADGSMRPHTYGVRVCSCAAIATEPCRPTACAGEYPCCTFTHPATAHHSLLSANSTYTFSAKEKDIETGLSYFGSRYYSSDLSVWLSVDQMSDKYPSLSPYTYCADNPVKLVDPNGDTLVIIGENGTQYKYVPGGICPEGVDYPTSQYWNRLNDLNNNKAGKVVVAALHNDKATYYISNNSRRGDNTGRFSEKTNTAYMGGHYSRTGELAHELFHAFQKMNGQGGESIHNEVEAFMFQALVDNDYFPLSQKAEMNGINPQYNSAVFNLFDNNDVDNFDTYFEIISKGFKKNAIINNSGLYQDMKDSLPNQKNNLVKQFFSHE